MYFRANFFFKNNRYHTFKNLQLFVKSLISMKIIQEDPEQIYDIAAALLNYELKAKP